MLLGKRPRPPMKRTTSMSEITLDLNVTPPTDPSNWFDQRIPPPSSPSLLSPTTRRTHSADLLETADFLRACSLCKRRLIPSRDIYMYRGDSAFCSQECRQQRMIQDERKEKRCLASNKQGVTAASESQVTAKGESVAAL